MSISARLRIPGVTCCLMFYASVWVSAQSAPTLPIVSPKMEKALKKPGDSSAKAPAAGSDDVKEKGTEKKKEPTPEERAAAEAAEQKRQEKWLDQKIKEQIKQLQCDRRSSAALTEWAAPPEGENPSDSEEDDDEASVENEDGPPAMRLPTGLPPELAAKLAKRQPASKDGVPNKETKAKLTAFTKMIKALERDVTLGHWAVIKTTLSSIEQEEHRKLLYLRILDGLAQAPSTRPSAPGISASQSMQMNLAMQQASGRRNRYPEKQLVSTADLVGLIEAAPCELEDALPKLGTLLSSSLTAGNVIDELMSRLLAEPPLVKRREAAKLLSSAGQDRKLGEFLPTMEEAIADDDREALNLLSRYYIAENQSDPKVEYVEQAWNVTLAALAAGEISKEEKEEALRRAVELASKVKEELSEAWMNESFRDRPERGKELLAAIGSAAGTALKQHSHNVSYRQRLLELQKTAVDFLLKASEEQAGAWQGALNLLAQNWIREAEITLQLDNSTSSGPRMQRDTYGNIFYLNRGASNINRPHDPRQPTPIPTPAMLEARPQERWHDLLEASIQSKFDITSSKLFLKVNEPEKAFPYIERMAEKYPEQAKGLAEEFLRVWTKNHNPNEERDRTNFYMFNWGYSNRAERIPLTRSKQNRNLKELEQWAKRLKQLPIDDWDSSLLVDAFMTSHSNAEVYRMSDVEGVFGSVDSLESKTLAKFAQRMRANLAGMWRLPTEQKKKQTRRKQKDIELEVQRGYQVATDLVGGALKQHPDDWQLRLAQACLSYDQYDYRNELQKSAEYSESRKRSLKMFADAAKLYTDSVEELSEDKQSVDVFERWLYASLGSPDIGQLKADSVPVTGETEKIGRALLELPKSLAEHHLKLFANNMFSRLSAVDPSCKFRYLREAFKIVGDHKQAHEAKKVFDYYNDLVTEIELQADIDGSGDVGEEPFGVFVNLHHSKAIERESGGFSRYLQNQNNGNFYNYGRPTENYRDKFEEATIAALEEQFEVLSVTFNRPNAHSKATNRPGWRVTPYAYLLLKARGPEVDKLPPLRLDLDFLDTSGYAILPIETSHVPLNAGTRSELADVPDGLQLIQILDERQASDGKLILEVKATARGLIPPIEKIAKIEFDEFEIIDTDDQDVTVIEFDEESDETAMKCERLCVVTMQADTSKPTPKSFQFARLIPSADVATVTYQRFVDADLKEAESTVRLERNYATSRRWLPVGILVTATFLLGLFARSQWRSGNATAPRVVYEMPGNVTPFTTINLLKHIHSTNGLRLSEKDELSATIQRLESHFFESPEPSDLDLKSLLADWIRKSGTA